MRTEPPLVAPIFRSDGQARILSALYLNDDEFSLTDLSERTDLAYATVHREVERLLAAGLAAQQHVGRTRLIRGNPDSPLFHPLQQILLIATGPLPLLTREFRDIEGIEAAFLFGSFAARMRGVEGETANDIDVMIIGTPDPDAIYDACQRVEDSVHRPVNPVITTRQEFDDDSGFHQQVRKSPVVSIVGDAPWW